MSAHRWLAATALFASAVLAGPSLAQADPHNHLDSITIGSNSEFDAAHGVVSGKGTRNNPYVISGWNLSFVNIRDTSKAVRIIDNTIGTLTLNFAGPGFDVHNNDISDLRVNENVERSGAPTSGTFMHNTFDLVGQVRHFDGRFAYNTVGASQQQQDVGWQSVVEALPFVSSGPLVTWDGFNGARFDHNTIYGPVDARLHGHHHSSGFGKASHMHTMEAEHENHGMVDHTKRYHEVTISDNTIYSNGRYALAYIDTNHAGNDRTASSENDPALEMPHTHFTNVAILRNKLIGSGLLIDVFNAEDEIHKGTPKGTLDIAGNTITLAQSQTPFEGCVTGIDVADARYMTLRMVSNSITGPAPRYPNSTLNDWFDSGEGVLLDRIDHAHITIDKTSVTSRRYGVRATDMSNSVDWTVRSLKTSEVEEPVSYDSSVSHPPKTK